MSETFFVASAESMIIRRLDDVSAKVEKHLKDLTDATVARLDDMERRLRAVESIAYKPVVNAPGALNGQGSKGL